MALRSAIKNGWKIVTVKSDTNADAPLGDSTVLQIYMDDSETPTSYSLDQETAFESQTAQSKNITLRTVYNCWITRDLSISDYIAACDETGVVHLKFLERSDLLAWLKSSSSQSEYIKADKSLAEPLSESTETFARLNLPTELSPETLEVLASEQKLLDQNTALHGSKSIDFTNVSSVCSSQILKKWRGQKSSQFQSVNESTRSSTSVSTHSNLAPLRPGKNMEPIIIISPSPSSIINMSNAKAFFEEGRFEPTVKSSSAPNLLRITKNLKSLGTVRFVVVDSTDMFKPHYWDRVVAVFVTGQLWQFRSYKWTDPNLLFQHVLGFALVYKGDQIPSTTRHWNAQIEQLDRSHRFRDREIAQRLWERIESAMILRGWPVLQ